jgi:NADPH:quinone reductase
MLKGFHYPLTPKGKSTLNLSPPWYYSADFLNIELRLTDGGRVDIVHDGVGAATFERSLRSLTPLGLLALYGTGSGPVPPFDLGRLAQMGSLCITHPISTDYVRTHQQLTAIMDAVFEMYAGKEFELLIRSAYALEDAAEVH